MYERFWSRYCSFVHSTNQGLSAIPASFSTVSLFIAHLHEIGLAPATISSHLSAISYYHIILDHPDPCDSPKIRRMLLGCRKLKNTKDNRKPLLHKHINLLLNSNNHVFSDNAYVKVMIKSLILLTYFGFFRMGELLPNSSATAKHVVQFSHVELLSKSIRLVLHHSKTNNSSKPIVILIHKESPHCPVKSLREFLNIRGSQPGPLFISAIGAPLTIQAFRSNFKQLLQFSQLSTQHYKLHSFRIGACTQAILSGVSEADVMRMGRWKSHAFKRYIRIPNIGTKPRKAN